MLARIIRRIKGRFPEAPILVRGDSGFCVPKVPQVLEILDQRYGDVDYLLGIAAAYTESGTYAIGFAHSASWKMDRMRYVGATRGDVPIFKDESGIVAGGRFLFRPQDSLWVGLDLAKGPEQYVVYVVAGH